MPKFLFMSSASTLKVLVLISAAELMKDTSVLNFSPEINSISAICPGFIIATVTSETLPTIFSGDNDIIDAHTCPFCSSWPFLAKFSTKPSKGAFIFVLAYSILAVSYTVSAVTNADSDINPFLFSSTDES